MNTKFVAYYRVSTDKQGIRGLGMDAQRIAVDQFVKARNAMVLASFEEVESGKHCGRPEVAKAIDLCRKEGATLVIAKLDRLARDLHFITGLGKAGVKFEACDTPNANELTINILAAVAQDEAQRISARTTAALEALKLRGEKLGIARHKRIAESGYVESCVGRMIAARQKRTVEFRTRILPIIEDIRRTGVQTLRGIADCLDRRGYCSFTGKPFRAQNVANLLKP